MNVRNQNSKRANQSGGVRIERRIPKQIAWAPIALAILALVMGSSTAWSQQGTYPYPAPPRGRLAQQIYPPASQFPSIQYPGASAGQAPLVQYPSGQLPSVQMPGQSFPPTTQPGFYPNNAVVAQPTYQSGTQLVVQPPTGAQTVPPSGFVGVPNPPQQQFIQPPGVVNQPGFPQPFVQQPPIPADIDINLSRLPSTGRFSVGGSYNSDTGILGQFIIDERDFNIRGWPRSWDDIRLGRAFRGAGETFRLEVVPGNEVQRYLISWGLPYINNSPASFNTSLYLFDRRYLDWDEQRLGGKFQWGYRLSPYLTSFAGLRLENVEVSNPRLATSPQLNQVVGDTDLYEASLGLTYDTRRNPFLTGEGEYFSARFKQGFGEFDYSKGEIEYRTYQTIFQRPDQSGRHILSYRTKLGVTGSQTPVFEKYFAGGFSSMRGFDFRGVSPIENGVRVGGEFQWLNSLEYMFPLTADDMIHGVAFMDFGTVEDSVTLNSENFRVAPGVGLRLYAPKLGLGAPLAVDFAFPVSDATGDEKQTVSFFLGWVR